MIPKLLRGYNNVIGEIQNILNDNNNNNINLDKIRERLYLKYEKMQKPESTNHRKGNIKKN